MRNNNLSDWIGNTQSREDYISQVSAQKMAAMMDFKKMPLQKGNALPYLWHWSYFTSITPASELGHDGHAKKGGFLPPVDLPRRMWAGSRLVFHAPITIGVIIEKKSTILNVVEKTGRSGDLAFVTVGHEYFDGDKHLITEEHDIVYKEMPKSNATTASDETITAPKPNLGEEWEHVVVPDTTMLFRYSAVTFNGHRIHYDREYCIKKEGYPGLVFHGPLTATLMLTHFLNENPDYQITGFSFKAKRPLFDTAPFRIVGRKDNGIGLVWALTPANEIAMQAEISYKNV